MSAHDPLTGGNPLPSRRALRGERAARVTRAASGPSLSAERTGPFEPPRVISLPDVSTTETGAPRTISLVEGADSASLPPRLLPTGPMPTLARSATPDPAPWATPPPAPAPEARLIDVRTAESRSADPRPATPPPADPRTGALRLAERTRTGPTAGQRRILSTPPVSFDPTPSASLRIVGATDDGPGVVVSADPAPDPLDFDRAVRGDALPEEETQLLPRAEAARTQDSPRRRARGGGAPSGAATVRSGSASSRAGRNLPMAIAVGAGLGGAVLASLLFRKEAFVGLVSAAVVIALWEMAGALAAKRIQIPVVPLVVGALGMLVSAYVAREEGLLVAFALTAFGVLLWRIIDGLDGAARDISAGVFTAAYVPFMAAFSIVMLAAPDGAMRVIVFIAVTVASDIGGLAAGIRFGRHPLAPSVSPRKSWEGLGGSVLACMIVATAGVILLLHGPWWAGSIVGAAVAVTATIGDLAESLLKRDLGVKDMGSVLPGHGGMMDRLDSLLLTAPASFLLLAYLVPVT